MVGDVMSGVVDEENRLAARLARTFDKPKSRMAGVVGFAVVFGAALVV